MPENSKVFPKSGGFENLLGYQIVELLYDITVRFAKRYIEPGSRTKDQMEQAARSGSRNLAEGSVFSATSKKIEVDQVARWGKEIHQRFPERTLTEIAGNIGYVYANVAIGLIDRQLQRLGKDFEKNGGFSERLHKIRTEARKAPSPNGQGSQYDATGSTPSTNANGS